VVLLVQLLLEQQKEYNGSTWTSVNSYEYSKSYSIGGAGTQTAALAFGGSPANQTATEKYDGTSWTTSPGSLNLRQGKVWQVAGIQTAALAFGWITMSRSFSIINRRIRWNNLDFKWWTGLKHSKKC
jgi:hypothetical protein